MWNCWFRNLERGPRGGLVCGLQNIDLTNDTIKILGIYFSYNKKIQTERNYLTTVKKIKKALNVWITRTLTLEERILIFSILTPYKKNPEKLIVSKILHCERMDRQINRLMNKRTEDQSQIHRTLSRARMSKSKRIIR